MMVGRCRSCAWEANGQMLEFVRESDGKLGGRGAFYK